MELASCEYILSDVTPHEVIGLVPDKCPDCGSSHLLLEGARVYSNDMMVDKTRRGIEPGPDYPEPLYLEAYGWRCKNCHAERFFDRIFRIATI